jgi:hypothetical protein
MRVKTPDRLAQEMPHGTGSEGAAPLRCSCSAKPGVGATGYGRAEIVLGGGGHESE